MRGEMDTQIEGKVLELTQINDVPKNATLLPAVWQMKCKRHIKTRMIYKWKARLNAYGSRMVHKRDYDQTYAPVASWISSDSYSSWCWFTAGTPSSWITTLPSLRIQSTETYT